MIDIYMGNEVVGKAVIEKDGLYYHIVCRCRLSGEVIYRLIADCNGNQVDLGICVPYDNSFGLEKRIPVKKLGIGEIRIKAVPKHEKTGDSFIPLRPEEPFSYLSQLERAYLAVQGGVTGVVIKPDS